MHERTYSHVWQRHMYMCVATHSHVWHVSFWCVPWLHHMCDATDLYVRRDSFICAHDWIIRVPWLTHLYAWSKFFKCVTRLIHICTMTRLHVRIYRLLSRNEVKTKCLTRPIQVSLALVASNILSSLHSLSLARLIYICIMNHSYVCIYRLLCQSFVKTMCVTWLIHVCDAAVRTKTFLEPSGCRTRQPGRTWLLGPGVCSRTNPKYPFCLD